MAGHGGHRRRFYLVFFFAFLFFTEFRTPRVRSPRQRLAAFRQRNNGPREREREKEHRVGPCLMNIHEDRRVSDAATEMWFFFPARRP